MASPLRQFFIHWRFEHLKRRRIWPVGLLALLLTVVLGIGLWQQRSARTTFNTTYQSRLEKFFAHKNPYFRDTELVALKKSETAYHQWFFQSLKIDTLGLRTTLAMPGAGLRLNVNMGSQNSLFNPVARTYYQYVYMRQHGITPMFPDSLVLVPSAGDFDLLSPQDKTRTIDSNPHFYIQGWYYLWSLIQSNWLLILFAIGALVTGRQWAKEWANKHAHGDWLRLQGERMAMQTLLQFGMIVWTYCEMVLLPLLLVTVIAGLTGGFGDLRYPVFNYNNTNGFGLAEEIMPLSRYLAQSFALIGLLILLLTLINLLLALLLRNSWLTALGNVLVVGVAAITPPIPFSPLTYFHVNDIVTGIAQKESGEETLQFWTVLPNLGLWCGALAAIITLLLLAPRIIRRIRRQIAADRRNTAPA